MYDGSHDRVIKHADRSGVQLEVFLGVDREHFGLSHAVARYAKVAGGEGNAIGQAGTLTRQTISVVK